MTEPRRLSVILRLAARGDLVSPAELVELASRRLVTVEGSLIELTADGVEMVEDLGPLPERDIIISWEVKGGKSVSTNSRYRAVVVGGYVAIGGGRMADGLRRELYTAQCATNAAGRGIAQEWIRAAENEACDRLGI